MLDWIDDVEKNHHGLERPIQVCLLFLINLLY